VGVKLGKEASCKGRRSFLKARKRLEQSTDGMIPTVDEPCPLSSTQKEQKRRSLANPGNMPNLAEARPSSSQPSSRLLLLSLLSSTCPSKSPTNVPSCTRYFPSPHSAETTLTFSLHLSPWVSLLGDSITEQSWCGQGMATQLSRTYRPFIYLVESQLSFSLPRRRCATEKFARRVRPDPCFPSSSFLPFFPSLDPTRPHDS
jgi:hypothetical protein